MPRLSVSPMPKKRFHGGRWIIYWYWQNRQFVIKTDYTDAGKTAAVNIDKL